jgi:hypothetical protein
MLRKTNMSLSKVISLRSAGFRDIIYLIPCFYVSSVIIQDFKLAITWYIIHNRVALAFSKIKFKAEKFSKLIYYLIMKK